MAKKVTTSKPKVEEVKKADQLNPKIVAGNFIVTIDKKKYSKKVTEAEGELLFKKIALYNKKPTDTIKDYVIKALTPAAVKEKKEVDDLQAKKKGYEKLEKRKAKEGTKRTTADIIKDVEALVIEDEESIKKLQAILDGLKKTEEKVTPNPAQGPSRRGEY